MGIPADYYRRFKMVLRPIRLIWYKGDFSYLKLVMLVAIKILVEFVNCNKAIFKAIFLTQIQSKKQF